MPILTEVGGIVKFGDLVEGVTMHEKLDEVTGLSRKVVIESRAADLRPRISLKDPKTGETLQAPEQRARRALPPARSARTSSRRKATSSSRRGHRQDPARDHEDAGHHRRSAPRRRALRGPQAEGPRHHREIDGEVSLRQGHQGQAQGRHHAVQPRRRAADRSGARVPDPEGQAHPGAAGRPRARGRAAAWTARRTRTTSCA